MATWVGHQHAGVEEATSQRGRRLSAGGSGEQVAERSGSGLGEANQPEGEPAEQRPSVVQAANARVEAQAEVRAEP